MTSGARSQIEVHFVRIFVDGEMEIGKIEGFRSTMLTPIMRPLSRAEKQDQSRYEDNNGDNNRTKLPLIGKLLLPRTNSDNKNGYSHILLINAQRRRFQILTTPALNERNKMMWIVMTRLKIVAGTGKIVAGKTISYLSVIFRSDKARRLLEDENVQSLMPTK
ncbi:hypothetical protein DY000_02003282 [Brassica cretica]|uniref:Uncharacterized protein n=1 Tax=Brassica cretica TaxID=69181 RepID=A0ABQ7C420_BRACR|nr:hypothetical protein DY000_02003282 [Brassica cretica]